MRTSEFSPADLRLLDQVLEEYARLGIGQMGDALEHLFMDEPAPTGWHNDMLMIRNVVSQHTQGNVDGWNSSLSIAAEDTPADAKIAWDLHKVIAHRLAWDRAVAAGHAASLDAQRDYTTMQGVHYDTPCQRSAELLATVEVTGQGTAARYRLRASETQLWTIVTALDIRIRTEAGDPRLALQALPLRKDLDAKRWLADSASICKTLARYARPGAGCGTTASPPSRLLVQFQDLVGCARRLNARDAAPARKAFGEDDTGATVSQWERA